MLQINDFHTAHPTMPPVVGRCVEFARSDVGKQVVGTHRYSDFASRTSDGLTLHCRAACHAMNASLTRPADGQWASTHCANLSASSGDAPCWFAYWAM